MRFLVTVVWPAILLFLVYLAVGVIVDGYCGAISSLTGCAESWRPR